MLCVAQAHAEARAAHDAYAELQRAPMAPCPNVGLFRPRPSDACIFQNLAAREAVLRAAGSRVQKADDVARRADERAAAEKVAKAQALASPTLIAYERKIRPI